MVFHSFSVHWDSLEGPGGTWNGVSQTEAEQRSGRWKVILSISQHVP